MITAKVIHKNAGWEKNLLKLLPELARKQIAVGFPKGKADLSQPHYKGGMSIIDVAAANEFGTERQPRRPFLHQSRTPLEAMFKSKQADIAKAAKKAIEKGGKLNATQALNQIALKAVSIVQDTIINGDYKENAEETIKRWKRGKDDPGDKRPLIDSGDMRKHVAGVIRKAGG